MIYIYILSIIPPFLDKKNKTLPNPPKKKGGAPGAWGWPVAGLRRSARAPPSLGWWRCGSTAPSPAATRRWMGGWENPYPKNVV